MITIKSSREIETMQRSGKITAKVLGDLMRVVKPGMTTKQLDALAEEGIREMGGVPAFMGDWVKLAIQVEALKDDKSAAAN